PRDVFGAGLLVLAAYPGWCGWQARGELEAGQLLTVAPTGRDPRTYTPRSRGRVPGDRATAAAALHHGRCRQRRRAGQRSRSDALHQRWAAHATRGDRNRHLAYLAELLRAVRGLWLLGGARQVER